MGLGKRQVLLAALVLALGAAVYLNWQFSDNKDLVATNVVNSTKELGEAKYVNNSVQPNNEANTSKNDVPEEKKVSGEANEFFAKAKLNRQSARDEATEMVKNVLNDIKSSEEAKAEAIKQAADIAKNIQQEANIESLVKAKGFEDCLAFIQNGECSVIVNAGSLNESTVITVKDIVSGQAGIDFDKIKITEAK